MASKLRPNDIVEVLWVDSFTEDKWASRSEYLDAVSKFDTMQHRSVGYLLDETERSITLVQSIAADHGAEDAMADAICIPLRAVDRVRLIERGID